MLRSSAFGTFASDALRQNVGYVGNVLRKSPIIKLKSMSGKCLVCERISKILNDTNPYLVAELDTGYVVIGDFQYFKGYALFLCKQHKAELHQLDSGFRIKFLEEMGKVAEAVYIAFRPKKLNYELLGNTDSHLHWHIFPRYGTDPCPNTAVWCVRKSARCSEKTRPSDKELLELKKRLLSALKMTARNIR